MLKKLIFGLLISVSLGASLFAARHPLSRANEHGDDDGDFRYDRCKACKLIEYDIWYYLQAIDTSVDENKIEEYSTAISTLVIVKERTPTPEALRFTYWKVHKLFTGFELSYERARRRAFQNILIYFNAAGYTYSPNVQEDCRIS